MFAAMLTLLTMRKKSRYVLIGMSAFLFIGTFKGADANVSSLSQKVSVHQEVKYLQGTESFGDGLGGDGYVLASSSPATATIIYLHGLGENGTDVFPAARALQAEMGHVRFVIPRSNKLVTPQRGNPKTPPDGRSWFDFTTGYGCRPDCEFLLDCPACIPGAGAGFNESFARIEKLIEKEVESGILSKRVMLFGYSQGGAMASASLLNTKQEIGGMFGLATWFPDAAKYKVGNPATAGVKASFVIGTNDTLIIPYWWKKGQGFLEELGYKVSNRLVPGETHRISLAPESYLPYLRTFVSKVAPKNENTDDVDC